MEDKSGWTPERRATEIACRVPDIMKAKWDDGLDAPLGFKIGEIQLLIQREIEDAVATTKIKSREAAVSCLHDHIRAEKGMANYYEEYIKD